MQKNKGDVHWLIPKRKKPIAYSTKAVSDFIVAMSQTYGTIQEIHDAINYDLDAKDILRLYIDKGYGNVIAQEMFW